MSRVAQVLGVSHPIIQGAMGVICNPELVAAVSAPTGPKSSRNGLDTAQFPLHGRYWSAKFGVGFTVFTARWFRESDMDYSKPQLVSFFPPKATGVCGLGTSPSEITSCGAGFAYDDDLACADGTVNTTNCVVGLGAGVTCIGGNYFASGTCMLGHSADPNCDSGNGVAGVCAIGFGVGVS